VVSSPDLGSSLELGKSPLHIETLISYLDLYPNKIDATLLKEGFTHGFRLGFTGSRVTAEASNLKSARLNPEVLKEKIQKEVSLGRFSGPFATPPLKNLKISPVGLVPKSEGSDFRLITHLSYPEGDSINDGISDELSSVSYSSFDQIVDMLFHLGAGAHMAKRDIKSAFRLLPISPVDYELLGLKDEEGFIYVDKFLPMGCKISCALFEKFATFLDWLVKYTSGLNTLDHYLDDFIFGGDPRTEDCRRLLDTFASVCSQLAVPVAHEKSVGPCTRMVILGLEVDSLSMTIRIPQHKLKELHIVVKEMLIRKKVTLKLFQSLVGKLSFFSRAIRASRAFLRRFYDAMIPIKKAYHRIRITKEIKEDLLLWDMFLVEFNGVAHIPADEWVNSDTLELFTDSAGAQELGCACILREQWAYFQWPSAWKGSDILRDITFLEMVPVLLAIMLWGLKLQRRRVLLRIDNEALVAVLNKQSSRSTRLMRLVRQFILFAMRHEIVFKAQHITTKSNSLADSISRKQWSRFRTLAPDANHAPEAIPEEFLSKIYSVNPNDC